MKSHCLRTLGLHYEKEIEKLRWSEESHLGETVLGEDSLYLLWKFWELIEEGKVDTLQTLHQCHNLS